MTATSQSLLQRHPVLATAAGIAALLVVAVTLFDWNWLRPPLERYISEKTKREFRASRLEVRLGSAPTIRLMDVYFGTAAWSRNAPAMALDPLRPLRHLAEQTAHQCRLTMATCATSITGPLSI